MKNAGELAFPIVWDGRSEVESGLSKREYIAIAALQGLLSQDSDVLQDYDVAAEYAVEYADALLAELEEEAPAAGVQLEELCNE